MIDKRYKDNGNSFSYADGRVGRPKIPEEI